MWRNCSWARMQLRLPAQWSFADHGSSNLNNIKCDIMKSRRSIERGQSVYKSWSSSSLSWMDGAAKCKPSPANWRSPFFLKLTRRRRRHSTTRYPHLVICALAGPTLLYCACKRYLDVLTGRQETLVSRLSCDRLTVARLGEILIAETWSCGIRAII